VRHSAETGRRVETVPFYDRGRAVIATAATFFTGDTSMFLINRKMLSAIGIAAAAVATTAFFASPAQAASAASAKVVGTNGVQFNAAAGQANALTITISGRTVTLADRVALKPGKGCKKVTNTKVKCTTSKKTTKLNVSLGDKNDTLTNKTGVYLLANGGTGNDTMKGGSGADQLQGAAGNDKLYGYAGNDALFGQDGNDYVYGGVGNDSIDAGNGNDRVLGEAGNDSIVGQAGNDSLDAGIGNDEVAGGRGNDTIFGQAGNDIVAGENGADTINGGDGNDTIGGGADSDRIIGGNGNDVLFGDNGSGSGSDTINGGAGADRVLGEAGNDRISGDGEDDFLIGEDITKNADLIGSNTALDAIDGGAETTPQGDICGVMAAGTVTNCETVGRASASAFAAKSAKSALGVDAASVAEAKKRVQALTTK
jgi:Ca2+-binding RTX toxin-like protein